MRGRQFVVFLLFVFAVVAIAGIPSKPKLLEINANGDPDLIPGRNVNMVSGITLPDGDPWLQRQNEPSIAVSTRNPLHLLAGANDYRTVDIPFSEGELPGQMQNQAHGDAWLGVFKSLDGGESWTSTLLDGYPQQVNSNSPLHGYQAAADPVVRAGTNGLFYYSGIVFNRLDPKNSAVFVARFIDNNNDEEGDPIEKIDITIIDELNGQRFKDKPWIAVDIPRSKSQTTTIAGQTIPKNNIYIAYSVFEGEGATLESSIMFCCSGDSGNTWGEPFEISQDHHLNQGATIAVDPRGNGHIYVAWRRFASGEGATAQSNAIVVARSTNGGKDFPDIIEVADVPGPFDQPTSSEGIPLAGTTFRTNSYPSMTMDKQGRIYIAWAQREVDLNYPNDSRVLIATSKDGFIWTTPMTVESSLLNAIGTDCHEFMPTITFAGGRLILAWYDTRRDYCPLISPFYISDTDPVRHTIDVRVAQGKPGEFPVFQPSVQVSRYLWAMWESSPGNYYFSQVQFNPPNYPLFQGGLVPFHGDYIDIAASPPLIQSSNGVWRFNTEHTDSQLFHLAWTDNRDVRPPENNDWTMYNPPASTQTLSQGQFFVSTPCTVPQNTGMRNQNIYTSLITSVMEAGSPGNNKPLGTLGTNPATGELIPRAFVIFVKNPTEDIRHYRLQITDQPDNGTASFLEFDMLEQIDVSIAPFSSVSRPLFVTSTMENDSVTVEVFEIDGPGGSLVPGGATSMIIINEDETNPGISGDLATTETHNPNIVNPNIVNWTYVNPNIVNPNIVNPNIVNPNIVNPNIVNPNIVNPNIVNPNIVNPNIVNPNIVNPNIVNPNIVNPNIVNSSIEDADVTDIEWIVTNEGNTVSSYTFKIFARESLPRGIYAQLLVYKTHYAPATDGADCQLQQTPHHELLLNIVNPNIVNPNIVNPNIVNPNIVNSAIENATFFLSPGDEAKAVLRLIDPDPGVTKFLQSGRKFKIQQFAESLDAAAGSQAVDSTDAQEGDTTVEADSTDLIIITSGLPDGTVEEPYPSLTVPYVELEAAGGDGIYLWFVNSEHLPPGLGFENTNAGSPDNKGIIQGIPQNDPDVSYPHVYSFLVQVSSGGDTDTQNLSIAINSAEDPTPPLSIDTTTLPPGTVGNYYGYTLVATGGTPPRTWSIASGSLPMGLAMDSSGVISGTIVNDPDVSTYPHNYEFVVQVTDAIEDIDTQPLTIQVDDVVYPDLTISGTITDEYGSAVPGVNIYGLPHAPQTDGYGYYSDTVPHGWTGTITPFKAGYTFYVSAQDPSSSRSYDQITENQYSQDFVADTINYTIAGSVTFYGTPVSGVVMNGLPDTPITDDNGYYSSSVPHGWSGTVTPELLDYIFDPPNRTYSSITSDHVLQDYEAYFVGVGQDDPFEDNDDLNNASRITPGIMTNLQLYDDDWFRVSVGGGEDLGVTVQGDLVNDIDVEIRDSFGNLLAGAYGSPQDETAFAYDLSSGWYYIRVIFLGDSGFWNAYSLTVETGDLTTFGNVTGHVTNESMSGIQGVEIWAYDTQSEHYFITITDSLGGYRFALPPSVYKLKFDASDVTPVSYVSEFYDSKYTYEDADELPLQAGDLIAGVDAQLEEGSVLGITTTSLPDGNISISYSVTLEAIGGATPYTWSLASGSGPLPNGLDLQEFGILDGIPTTTGTFPFTVRVTDSSSPTAQADERAYSITIGSPDNYPEGMISYWKFDEGDGSSAYDCFDTNHGTIIGATWVPGQVNGALSFDAQDDFVSVGEFAGYSDNVSVEAWIRTTGSGGIDNWDDIVCGPVGDIIFGVSGNRLNFAGQGATPIDHNTWSTTLLNDNEWHHVVGTYDGSQVCVYVDGQQEACNPASGTFTPGFKRIGRAEYDGEYFNGLIDEVAIYHRALSPLEVEQHYQNGLNGLGYEGTEESLVITTTFLPDGNLATAYNAQLDATGGTEPYSWSLAVGSDPLPEGLTLSGNGLIHGTPSALGTFGFIVEVTDGSSPLPKNATQPLSITIHAYAGTDYVISGTVSPPLAGVVMQGLPGDPVTNVSGDYTAVVYSGWSGEVTPILADHAFTPPSRIYNNVSSSHTGENYTATDGHEISGQVTLDGSPLEGVLLSGLPTNPYTDSNGQYSGAVHSGWSGTVAPTLPGFTFTPASIPYANVTGDQPDQDYTANFLGGQDDAHENNDGIASAADITLGTHMNLVLADADWFRVHIPAGNDGKDLRINVKAHAYPEPDGYEDMDFVVLDESEKMLGYVLSSSDDETLYITDIASGWYYIGQTYISQMGTVYSLTLEISDNFGIGYVSGRITDEMTGQPIDGIYVELYGEPFDWGDSRPLVTTDENGEYRVGYLPGDYTVQLNTRIFNDDWAPDRNYLPQSYNSNEILAITAGETIVGIDEQLKPGGTITGRITDPDGNGQANNGLVYVYSGDNTFISYDWTDANGNYSVERIPRGNFKVRARAGVFGSMWYDGMGSFADGHPVPVQGGATTSNIDLQLEDSAIIQGCVTDSGNNPIQGVNVTAIDPSGIALISGRTDADGNYWIGRRLPTGQIKILFDARYASGNFASEYHSDKLLVEDADPISVQSGQTTVIDAVLSAGGTISGRVTNSQGQGFGGVAVHCFDIDSDRYYRANTDSDGNYTISDLVPDEYRVRFRTTYENYATQWHNGANSFDEGTTVSVAAGADISGIDAQLVDNGGFISGRVTNMSGHGIKDVRVLAQDITKEAAIAWADTNADGYYRIPRIPTCQAKVKFDTDRNYLNYVTEWHNGMNSHANAGTVDVFFDQETPNINAVPAPVPSVNITTTALSNGEVAVPYNAVLEVTGGRELYHFSLISGDLPPGLMFNGRGEIMGTPIAVGEYHFTVRVTDSCRNNQLIDTQTLSLTINAYAGTGYLISGIIIADGSPLGGVVLQGLPGNPVTSANGEYIVAVPEGWSGTATPTLSGYFFDPPDLEYDNVQTHLDGQDYTAHELTLNITTEWLLNGTDGYSYNQSLSAEGGTEPYVWSLMSGNLPNGLTLDSDGTISGTPTHTDNFDFTVRVTDSNSPISQYVDEELSITIHGDAVNDYPLLYWKLDEGDGTIALDSSGNSGHGTLMGNVTYSTDAVDGFAAEILSNGWIEKSQQGPFHFVNQASIFARVKIVDYNQQNRFVWKLQYDEPYRGHPFSLEISLDINGDTLHLDSGNGLVQDIFNCQHYQIDVNLPSNGFVTNEYNQIAVTIEGDVYRVFINGNEVASSTGAPFEVHDYIQHFWLGGADWSDFWLGGTIDEVLAFNMAFEPQDISTIYGFGVLPTISGAVSLSDGSPLPWVWMDQLGDVHVQENGEYIGVVATGWSGTVTPQLGGYFFEPPNRSYDNVTTSLTGQDYTAYEQGSLYIQTNSIPNGKKGDPYDFTLAASGGTEPYNWSVVSGSLPAGLTLDSSGQLSGTPTEAGDFSFSVRVIDSESPSRAAQRHLTLFVSAAHQDFWTSTYPGGGDIHGQGLAYDQMFSNTVYATAGGRGIFRSEDGGDNWINLNDDPDWPYGESDYPIFWTHPGQGHYFMSTWGFLYMSEDGYNWQQIYSRDNWDMISFAVDPWGVDEIYVGTDDEGIFKTTDGGQNWASSSTGLPSDEIRVIAIDPNDHTTLYAGTSNNGLFKSEDSGASWTSTNTNIIFQTISDIVIPDDSHVYVAGTDSSFDEGLYRSTDFGATWEKLPVNAGVSWNTGNYIAVEYPNLDTIYFASYQSVFKTTDGGVNWIEYSVSSSSINSLLLDRHNQHILYVGTQGEGVFKSEDSGVTWNPVNNGLRALHFVGDSPHGLEIDKTNPDYIYAGSTNGGYRSTDGGSSWEKMDHPSGSILAILTHPDAPGVVYSYHNALEISTTNGSSGSWVMAAGFPCCFARGDIGIATDDPNLIYVGTWGPHEEPTGVYKTTDRGLTFTLMNNGLTTNTEVQTIAVHPADHDTVFIGLRRNWPFEEGMDYGIYKTTDGGINWSKITCDLPEDFFTRQIIFCPSDHDVMYMLGEMEYECGVYKSVDGGDCWSQISWLCGNAIAVDPGNPDLVYLGAWNDFFVSLDGGNTWIEFNDGLPRNPGIDAIALDPNNPQHVFIGTAAGVYEATFVFDFVITTENLPWGAVGEPYSTTLQTAGGTPPVTWELVSGEMPEEFTLNETNGEISGTPMEAGYWNFTIRATDTGGNSYTKQYDLNVFNKYELSVGTNPQGVGSVSLDPDEPSYIEGSMVDVSVTIPQGYIFTGWSGDATGKATLVHVEMSRDKTLTANFALPGSLPDYDISSFSAPSSASSGETIGASITATVGNIGAADPYQGDISVGIYLSTDPEITVNDVLLWKGRSSISALSGGTTDVPVDVDLQIPTTVAAGSYHIGVHVDEFDVVAEQNEDNNHASQPISIASTAYSHLELLGMWTGGGSNMVACDEARNLAFVAHGTLLEVLDVSDPSDPLKIAELAMSQYTIADIELEGDYAYVANSAGGLRIVNVTDPANPSLVGFNESPYLARGVVVSGNHAFVTDHFNGGLRVFNISDPANPTEDSFLEFPGRTRGIARSGDILYLAASVWNDGGEYGIRVIDISTPTNPTQVNFFPTQGSTGWPEVAGDYLFNPTGGEGLLVLDISTPQAPTQAAVYDGLGNSGWINVVGGFACVNDNDRNAIVALNVSDVGNIYEVGVHHFEDQNAINSMDVLGTQCYANGWYHSLKILEMSDPQNPYEIGSYDAYEGILRDVDVSGDHAYLTTFRSNAESHLRSLDLSNLPDITEIGTMQNPNFMYRVSASGNLAYVNTENRELKAIDISDPSYPHEVGVLENFENIYDFEVSGDYAFIADNYGGLKVVDIATPSNPVHISTWQIEPRAVRLAISGNYAYVTAAWGGVKIIDISDPMNPWEVGAYQVQDFRAFEVAVCGNYVYVEDIDYNVRIIDVSDPRNPTEVATFQTDENIYDLAASGNVVFIASLVNGTLVMDASEPSNPVQIDQIPMFITRAIKIKENRIYILNRDGGMLVYEFRRD
jgi:photosystem II stability/assembly factor-like uncharacterized protein